MLDNKNYRLEWCTDDAIAALPLFHTVDQVEWCSRLDLDGLTPDFTLAQQLIIQSPVPVKVMLRNRAGDFCYNKNEIDAIIETGLKFRDLGYDRFVFGAIRQGRLDVEAIVKVANALAPAQICIHKAIDVSSDILGDISLLNEIKGINEVLTSGGAPTALEGAEMLKNMHSLVKKEISIVGAGKITRENVALHHEILGLKVYHGKRMA